MPRPATRAGQFLAMSAETSGMVQGSAASSPKGQKSSRRTEASQRMKQLCQHGAVAAASPAALNRVPVPGPGSYTTTPRTEEITKPVNCRVLMGRRPRFQKEGALFNAGIESNFPGPGAYEADKIMSLGRCKVSVCPCYDQQGEGSTKMDHGEEVHHGVCKDTLLRLRHPGSRVRELLH
ncbi:hypothetical protein AK812_SmicGene16894 [Symbiodinium microadriaticum]|uniref:Uncharacterized protein n=1 Tax=Symbiodinium microadriaticum TaxID=2951 RepID=A0A1Q9DZ52_SYMMI|nr:hypothetical protein AK812_SmicGene16894 [Symbiodinium microadriaticum]